MRWLVAVVVLAPGCGSGKSDADKATGLVREILKGHGVPATPSCPDTSYATGKVVQCTATDSLGSKLVFDIAIEQDKFRGTFAGAIIDVATVRTEARRLLDDGFAELEYPHPTLLVPRGTTLTLDVNTAANVRKIRVSEKDPARHTIDIALVP
ncbi:MAG: hypothetical protein WKG01_07005 [Kofleriaceae bacterium]